MKRLVQFFIIFFLFSVPANAACDFMIKIGEKGTKVFEKFAIPLPGFKGMWYMPVQSPEVCPNDNLNKNIAVEYVFLGDKHEQAKLAAIRMIVLNDGSNTENNKFTLMNYAKKVYGDFDTGQNPEIFNSYNIWENGQSIVIYKRMLDANDLIEEEIMITNLEYDQKLGSFFNEIEAEAEGFDKKENE